MDVRTVDRVPLSPAFSRRNLLKGLGATTLTAGLLRSSSLDIAAQDNERDPLVRTIEPITVGADAAFIESRGYDIGLNLTDYSQAEAQNQIDLVVLELFSIMHRNRRLVNSGEYPNRLEQGKVPEGYPLEEFAEKLGSFSDEQAAIPLWYYPDGVTLPNQAGTAWFDPRRGAEVVFTEAEGLFAHSTMAATGKQIYGCSPRLTDGTKLRLEIHNQKEAYEAYEDRFGSTAEQLRDGAYSFAASQFLQIFGLTYGNSEWWYQYAGVGGYRDVLWLSPYHIFSAIPTRLSGKDDGAYWNWSSPGKYLLHAK